MIQGRQQKNERYEKKNTMMKKKRKDLIKE